MVPRVARVLVDPVEDEPRRGQIGVADREIEDFPARRLGLVALSLQLREEVPRQGLEPGAFLGGRRISKKKRRTEEVSRTPQRA
jgi:hypothetical protein